MRVKAAISIIIVNWKVCELLRECLRSLQAHAGFRPDAMQVIVVDNDSGDGSVEMVAREFPDVTLIANAHNVGFGRANNQALPLCSGRYIVLLNPDTVVLGQAVRLMVERMDAFPDVAAMGCRLLNADHSLQRWTGGAFPRGWNIASHYLFLDRLLPRSLRPAPLYLDHDPKTDIDVDWVSGACMILRQTMLNDELFDPAFFMYGEDMELCHRLKTAGHRVVYSPAASIVHYQGASMKQQRGDVLLSSLKGPRQFYRQMRGEHALWWFDLLTVSGFALRCALYTAADWLRPGQSFAAKAASSKDLMERAWHMRHS
jgi:N-acetylglucosaminyl-diphospho-decaprenol L-rhamnosyltransferase